MTKILPTNYERLRAEAVRLQSERDASELHALGVEAKNRDWQRQLVEARAEVTAAKVDIERLTLVNEIQKSLIAGHERDHGRPQPGVSPSEPEQSVAADTRAELGDS